MKTFGKVVLWLVGIVAVTAIVQVARATYTIKESKSKGLPNVTLNKSYFPFNGNYTNKLQ